MKPDTNHTRKILKLSAETVRTIAGGELDNVRGGVAAGGGLTDPNHSCNPACYGEGGDDGAAFGDAGGGGGDD